MQGLRSNFALSWATDRAWVGQPFLILSTLLGTLENVGATPPSFWHEKAGLGWQLVIPSPLLGSLSIQGLRLKYPLFWAPDKAVVRQPFPILSPLPGAIECGVVT